jgi:hypothetical protein
MSCQQASFPPAFTPFTEIHNPVCMSRRWLYSGLHWRRQVQALTLPASVHWRAFWKLLVTGSRRSPSSRSWGPGCVFCDMSDSPDQLNHGITAHKAACSTAAVAFTDITGAGQPSRSCPDGLMGTGDPVLDMTDMLDACPWQGFAVDAVVAGAALRTWAAAGQLDRGLQVGPTECTAAGRTSCRLSLHLVRAAQQTSAAQLYTRGAVLQVLAATGHAVEASAANTLLLAAVTTGACHTAMRIFKTMHALQVWRVRLPVCPVMMAGEVQNHRRNPHCSGLNALGAVFLAPSTANCVSVTVSTLAAASVWLQQPRQQQCSCTLLKGAFAAVSGRCHGISSDDASRVCFCRWL